MTIVLNCLSASIGGGWTYIHNILPELARVLQHRYYVVVDRSAARKLRAVDAQGIRVIAVPAGHSLAVRLIFEQVILPLMAWKLRAAAIICPADVGPLLAPGRTKIILMLRNPNTVATGIEWEIAQRWRLRLLRLISRLSARRADALVYVSAASSRHYMDAFSLHHIPSRVIHHGIAENFGDRKEARRLDANEPYILSVSSIYRYKNFVRLIEAYARLIREGRPEQLLIVGRNLDSSHWDEMTETIRRFELGDRVNLVGAVPYKDVGEYYTRAALCVFPSYLETFGHPILEAMQSGVPLACSDIPVCREVAGDAALYFDPFSVDAMATAMSALLTDDEQRERLIMSGKKRVSSFRWSRTAENLVQLLEEVAG